MGDQVLVDQDIGANHLCYNPVSSLLLRRYKNSKSITTETMPQDYPQDYPIPLDFLAGVYPYLECM
jgi:hypothetical protein